VPDIDPIKRANSVTKSRSVYFLHKRWKGKEKQMSQMPMQKTTVIILPIDRYACKKCRYKFDDSTGTYLEKIRIIPLNIIVVHFPYLFLLAVSAYQIRFYVKVSLKTIEHTFRIF